MSQWQQRHPSAISAAYRFQVSPDAESIQIGVAVGDVDVARQHFESGRLSGAVDAQKTEAFAPSHAQTKVINCSKSVVVVLYQIS